MSVVKDHLSVTEAFVLEDSRNGKDKATSQRAGWPRGLLQQSAPRSEVVCRAASTFSSPVFVFPGDPQDDFAGIVVCPCYNDGHVGEGGRNSDEEIVGEET